MSERKFKIGDHVEWCRGGDFKTYEHSAHPQERLLGFVMGYMLCPFRNIELINISRKINGKVFAHIKHEHTRLVSSKT